MPLLINQNIVSDDSWRLIDEDTTDLSGDIIVPLELYTDEADKFTDQQGRIAILIGEDNSVKTLLAEPNQYELIVIDFSNFGEGRGFSFANMLRRADYTGQLRATGYVTRDRLGYMQRCGFDAFDISEEHYENDDAKAWTEISINYQGAADNSQPIYHQKG